MRLGLGLGQISSCKKKLKTFISTWKTDNAGTSNDDQIILPLEAGGTYDFFVRWGDGTSSHITAYNDAAVTHTYSAAGTYTVKIDGVINGWYFNNGGDNGGDLLKITDISQWGDLLVGNSGKYFYGCANLDISATDVLDVSNVTTLYRIFFACTSLTTLDVSSWDVSNVTTIKQAFRGPVLLTTLDVSSWDTSKVTDMYQTFYALTNLTTLDVSSWDTGKLTNMNGAFYGLVSLTTLDISSWDIGLITDASSMLTNTVITNYSDVLIAWAAQAPSIQNNVSFGMGANTYNDAGAAAKALLMAPPYNWDITDGGSNATPVILEDGNTVAWFDYIENITKDGSSLVSVWGDKSGEDNDLLQAVGSKQPLFGSTGILFNGINSVMKCVAFTLEQPEFFYVVLKQVTWIDNQYFWDGEASDSVFLRSHTATPKIQAYSGSLGTDNDNLAVNTYSILRVLYNGASSKLQVNETTPTAENLGIKDSDGFTLGAYATEIANEANIEVKEFIIRKVADNPTDEAIIYNYLKDKYGL